MKRVQSTCNYCALDCNLDFYVKDGTIVKVVPTEGYPVNEGSCCIKGMTLAKQQTVIETAPLPQIRQQDQTTKMVSWEEGFQYVAKELLRIRDTYGEDSVAGISTGQLTMEEFALFGHVMRNFLRANVDGNTRLCMATAVVAHKQSYGFDAPGFTLQDLEYSDTMIFIGANPVVAHPVLWEKVRKNQDPNKRIVVVDPRKSETARNATHFYPITPKTDLVFLYTVAKLLIEKDYVNQEYIDKHTNNYEEFVNYVAQYDVKETSQKTGLSVEQIEEFVELIHSGKRVSFWWTMGVNQGYEAVRTAQAIINLALMTGNIGRPGTGANSLTGQCNAMGSRAYSNTTGLYGGGDYDNQPRRKQVAEALYIRDEDLIDKPTIPYNQIVEQINAGKIKALWVLCTNPKHSWINNQTFATAAKKLELFVVQDIYDTIETAEDATVFFPVVSGIKKQGTYINMERRISAMRPVVERGENEKTDYEVIYGVGEALGMGDLLKAFKTPKSCFEAMQRCSKGMPLDMTGISWEGLEDSHGVQWPCKEGEDFSEDNRRLYTEGLFYTPNKRANFVFEEPQENPLPTTAEFPTIFNTGRGSVGQWHTQTRTKEIRSIEEVSIKVAYLYLNTEDAKKMNVRSNDHVVVYSINGEQAEFLAIVSDGIKSGQVYAPMHYIQCNKLTASIYDKYSKEPSYKATPVRVEKKEEENV